jgi:hypothetical protein
VRPAALLRAERAAARPACSCGARRRRRQAPLLAKAARVQLVQQQPLHSLTPPHAPATPLQVYSLCGYIAGVHPPGRHARLFTAGRVLLHMLQAHCAAYAAIKALPAGPSLCVGLVHHHIMFMALGDGCLHSLARWGARGAGAERCGCTSAHAAGGG